MYQPWLKQIISGIIIYLFFLGVKVNAQTHYFRVLAVTSRSNDHEKMMTAAKPFFEKLAKENHFDIDITDDTSKINEVNLKNYQVFVMLQLAPFDMSYNQQDALQRFVEQGKGWVGIHAAGLTGTEFLAPNTKYWQWFENLMGNVVYS
ncbi:MAG TPA: ThuA domain-containing protein, partial [Mucilaginibacter sp.]|nr:ThuA domain-containing protein [Mucilaginibacter sp.]